MQLFSSVYIELCTLSNMVCLVIHRNVMHQFRVQALQNPLLCSSTNNSISRNNGPIKILIHKTLMFKHNLL
jgi:hypothetical protein